MIKRSSNLRAFFSRWLRQPVHNVIDRFPGNVISRDSYWKRIPLFEMLESRSLMAVLGPGDIAFTSYQATTTDKISFVLLKSVDSGTVLTLNDNAWTGSAFGTSEGTSTITFGANFGAGTQLNYDASRTSGSRWAVGGTTAGLTDSTTSNFGLNASGDNLFAYNGTAAPTDPNSSSWVAAFASNAFVASGGATSTSLTQLPTAFVLGDTAFSLNLPNGAANENGAMTQPTSVSGNAAQVRTVVHTLSNWTTFTTAGAQAVPPAVNFSVNAPANNPPTSLSLSNSSIPENAGVNATVGTFTTTDPNAGDTFSYILVTGAGSIDNSSFNISGNTLRANTSFDFETKSSYSIRVRTTDQGGLFFEQAFTITILNASELDVRLNEIKANPPGNATGNDKYQYIELSGSPGLSLSSVFLVMLNGNGSTAGQADYVINLSGRALGSNGLLVISSPTGGHLVPTGTTSVTDTLFDSVGGILSKETVSFYLVTTTGTFTQGTDYDTNNDGVLDNLPGGLSILDSVGWSDGGASDIVYGGVALTQTQGTPDAATRIVGTTTTSVSDWFNGDLYDLGNDPSQLLYDSTRASVNLPTSPLVASLTPGALNFEQAAASTTLRFVSYNITASDPNASPPGSPRNGLATILQAIGSEVVAGISRRIDLLAIQEILSQATTSTIVAGLLNTAYSTTAYVAGNLNGASTGAGTQGVVYNSQTLTLLEEKAVGVASGSSQPRQAVRHKFRPVGTTGSSDFYVYNMHWKAADSGADEARRLIEAQAVRADADTLGNANIIYVGDFNVYRSSDNGFQAMLAAGNGQAHDPVNRLGDWTNNPSFLDVLTQAPASSPPAGLVGGGLDDRFDFQLVSGELLDGQGLDYRSSSYHTFGNNGSVALNGSINSASNTALAGLANRTDVLNLLTTVTDHLPVVADFTLPLSTAVNHAPAGANNTLSTNEDVPLVFATNHFGFSDPNDSPADNFLAVRIASLPISGSLTLNGSTVSIGQSVPVSAISAGNLRFTPAANASGSPYASFTFQVQDNGGTANGGVDLDPTPNALTVTVSPVNDPPTIQVNTGLIVNAGSSGNVISSAALQVTDIDNTAAQIAYTIVSLPTQGSLLKSGLPVGFNGTFTQADIAAGLIQYTSNATGATTDSFQFSVSDGAGGAIATTPFTITVNSINLPPTITSASSVSVVENSTGVAYTIVATDPNPGTVLTYNISGSDVARFAVNSSTGAISFLVSPDFELPSDVGSNNVYDIVVTASDGTLSVSKAVSIIVTDAPDTLIVTNFVNDSSGFTATFNSPIVPGDLNLYDQQGLLGVTDVTIIGNTVGLVRGTLVIAPGNSKVTFVRTGGILPNDTYTVTFRSGADAFHTSQGVLLDGNADSIAGDAYTHTFTVNAPANAISLGVPDFARGFGQQVAVPNTATGLPLVVSNGKDVASVDFTLKYDPSLLAISGFSLSSTLASGGAAVDVNTQVSGQISLAIYGTSAFSTATGPLTLGNFIASVPTSAPYGAKQVLEVTSVTVFDNSLVNEIPAVGDDAIHVAAYFGDISGNRLIQSNDAAIAARIANQTFSGSIAFQTADPTIIADISGNSTIQANDAALIARRASGLDVPQIPAIPLGLPAPTSGVDRGYDSAASPVLRAKWSKYRYCSASPMENGLSHIPE